MTFAFLSFDDYISLDETKGESAMPANDLRLVNLEQGMPMVDEARRRLIRAIDSARTSGVRVLKIVHGYGSTGVGGKLKVALTRSLTLRKKEGRIRGFIRGEDWSVFNEATRKVLEDIPCLKKDPDINQGNAGMTIVFFPNPAISEAGVVG